MTRTSLSHPRRSAFTLIELLVVMAITAILLGLIFGPMVQSFNLTNRARVQVLAQDSARAAMETIQRDMANGVFIFHELPDPSKTNAADLLPGEYPSANSVSLWVRDSGGNTRRMLLPYGLLDMVPPARVYDQNIQLNPADIDPTTGLAIARGDMALPVAPGRVVIRYWLGTRDNRVGAPGNTPLSGMPVLPYGNFYESQRDPNPQLRLSANLNNPVLLFRAIVSPYMPNLVNGQAQVDTRLFHKIGNSNTPRLYEPNFWYDASEAQAVTLPDGTSTNAVSGWRDDNGDGRVNVCENWRAIARSVVPNERADEVTLQRDDQKRILYDANGMPRITHSVRFQPTYVGNDSGAPTSNSDAHNEAPNVSPSSYQETNGHWTLPYRLYVFRSPLNAPLLQYFIENGDGQIRAEEYDTSTGQTLVKGTVPFQRNAAGQLAPGIRPDIMFNVDTRRGLTNFAFPAGLVMGYDPFNQPNGGTVYRERPTRFDPAEPNNAFDPVNNQVYRFVTLAKLDPSLNPALSAGYRPPLEVQGDGRTYVPNVRIVPGSERVFGPDQIQGPHYGRRTLYTRIPRNGDPKSIGPNQYMVNFTDFAPAGANPNTLDITQKMGTIIFDSNQDQPGAMPVHAMPKYSYDQNGNPVGRPDPIEVTYQIQNNLPSDIVKADYLTRQLMTISLGVRLFEFNSGQPQQVTLTQKIKIRNLQR